MAKSWQVRDDNQTPDSGLATGVFKSALHWPNELSQSYLLNTHTHTQNHKAGSQPQSRLKIANSRHCLYSKQIQVIEACMLRLAMKKLAYSQVSAVIPESFMHWPAVLLILSPIINSSLIAKEFCCNKTGQGKSVQIHIVSHIIHMKHPLFDCLCAYLCGEEEKNTARLESAFIHHYVSVSILSCKSIVVCTAAAAAAKIHSIVSDKAQ